MRAQDHGKPSHSAGAEPMVTVAVYDDVKLPEKVLAQSADEVTRIFHKAGVTTVWITCKSSKRFSLPDVECDHPLGPTHLALRIVRRAWKAGDSIFGMAFLSETGTGAYGDVFYDSVEKLHHDWGVSVPRVLGHVMAHELGHLLLGNAHTREGIMCPSWRGQQLQRLTKGGLLFSREQAEFIRERLSRDRLLQRNRGDQIFYRQQHFGKYRGFLTGKDLLR
jgi:hypothetical protein